MNFFDFRTPDTYFRSGFNRFIESQGEWCVYVRGDRRLPCSCYDPQTESSGNPNCPDCFGIGYKVSFERIKGHVAYDTTKTYSSQSGIAPAYVGEVASFGAVFYSPAKLYPQTFDILCEVEWNVPYGAVQSAGVVTRLLRAWKLKATIPVISGSQGVVDLYLSGLEQYGVQKTYIEDTLRGLGTKLKSPYYGTRYNSGTPDAISYTSAQSRPVIDGLGRASRKLPPQS